MHAFTEMVRGIQLYQRSQYEPLSSRRKEIWRAGQTSLSRIMDAHKNVTEQKRDICVLVPSLINGSAILDLCAERSLAQWLTTQGIDVYLLDWGDLMKEEPSITIETLVCDRLGTALRFLSNKVTGEERNIHVLGYCMGGALALGLAARSPELLDTLTLLATPWDFHAGERKMLSHVQFWAPSAMNVIESKNFLSADQLQSLFAGIDPMLTHKKFSRFSKMEMESEEARIFIAVEDWLNDGKDLPAGIARECIMDWFIHNGPYSGSWILKGDAIDLAKINIPIHIVASKTDRLVEYEAALGVRSILTQASLTEPDCGHIGMIAGKRSVEQVWQPIARWMKKYAAV